jgi:excisionase family DNA binding protein
MHQPREPEMRSSEMPVQAKEPLLTVRDIAESDNCSEKTVRRAIAAGLLEAIRIGPGGRILRIEREAHEHYRGRFR